MKESTIIDGTNLILGRLSAIVAKRALLGESFEIVNCDDIFITGKKKQILNKFKQRIERGIPQKGPFYPRQPEMIVKRTIKGMLPHKNPRGKEALLGVKCYHNIPEKLKNTKKETLKEANISKIPNVNYVKLRDIEKYLH